MIDVVITATRRAELLRRTLASFKANLLHPLINVRVIINIDPVGPDPDEHAVLRVCAEIFPGFKWNAPEKASFPAAFKWVWSQVNAPWVLQLEDDWELLRPVDLNAMFALLEKHRDLVLLRLPAFQSAEETMKNWNKFFPWNGEFFECPADLRMAVGFCGHPSLIRGEFVMSCAKHLYPGSNPEKQFHSRNGAIRLEVLKWRYGVFAKQNASPLVADIGRRWMIQNGWRKEGSKAFFQTWVKV